MQACSRQPSPQAGWRGQGTAAHLLPTREKNVRVLLCSCSQRLQDGACGCTLKSMQRERVGLTSKATRLSICDAGMDGIEGESQAPR